ncbi:hypothetical protein HK105_203254 [Polyrhizophydium stewartii]|uniref:Transcriptional regulatory protein n=1 Tax=Polyrhizophydium stewartii TaxID=2732419 RepID=A0ABR4NCE3_9FUNG
MRAQDIARVVRQIVSGIKAMGGETDPSLNHYLASALHQAKTLQIPKANVEDAIKRATTGGGSGAAGDAVKRVVYEGLSPVKSVAVMVEALTANSNKTTGEIRLVFKKAPGSSLTPVAYLFQRRGRIVFGPGTTQHGVGEMTDAAIDVAVDDIGDDTIDDDSGKPLLERALEAAGYDVRELESGYFGIEPVALTDPAEIAALERFVEALEEQEEVVKVSHNAVW